MGLARATRRSRFHILGPTSWDRPLRWNSRSLLPTDHVSDTTTSVPRAPFGPPVIGPPVIGPPASLRARTSWDYRSGREFRFRAPRGVRGVAKMDVRLNLELMVLRGLHRVFHLRELLGQSVLFVSA